MDIEWQCPSCTLLNRSGSFKCRACGTHKGTSTRQSKHTVAHEQQYLAASLKTKTINKSSSKSTLPSTSSSSNNSGNINTSTSTSISKKKSVNKSSTSKTSKESKVIPKKKQWPVLKDIDRSSGVSYSVTVGSVTVVFTEYKLLQNTISEQ